MKKRCIPKGYVPSMKDADWFINNWKEEGKFFVPVEIMYKVCKQYPRNNDIQEVLQKCAIINSFSSTNVYDLYSMASHIVSKHIDEKLINNNLSLVNDIAEVEIGGKLRYFYSFASKYCHYHNPERFAIYDRYVAKVLCSFPNEFRVVKEEQLRDYKSFIEILNEFRSHYKLNLSFDDLDKYLWRLGRWYLNQYEPTSKYYHREDSSPFEKYDIKNKFWNAEKEFFTSNQNMGKWKEKGKEWFNTGGKIVESLSGKHTQEQFSLIMFIYEKYNNPSWIIEY